MRGGCLLLTTVLLKRQPLRLATHGLVRYSLRDFRIGAVEVDLLSGWVSSGGRLPCVTVVVRGLELRLEAFRPQGGGGSIEGEMRRAPRVVFDFCIYFAWGDALTRKTLFLRRRFFGGVPVCELADVITMCDSFGI